jgi:hypothetical protein
MDEKVLAHRAHAIMVSLINRPVAVCEHILREFTEFLPELPYIEEVSYTIDEDQDPLEITLLISFTNGPNRMWSLKALSTPQVI